MFLNPFVCPWLLRSVYPRGGGGGGSLREGDGSAFWRGGSALWGGGGSALWGGRLPSDGGGGGGGLPSEGLHQGRPRPPRYSQLAICTHPTRMQSCYHFVIVVRYLVIYARHEHGSRKFMHPYYLQTFDRIKLADEKGDKIKRMFMLNSLFFTNNEPFTNIKNLQNVTSHLNWYHVLGLMATHIWVNLK